MLLRRLIDGRVAVEREEGLFLLPVASIGALLQRRVEDIRALLESELEPASEGTWLPPIDGRTEVWASGVTYRRSREARMGESADPDIYDRVYAAERPELFFKSAAWRVVGDGEFIGIREDSEWNVPEPELAVVANRYGEIIGYGICNDVSSRSLEGENPLYLPQAKVYAGACAIGGGIRPVWELDLSDLEITLRIERNELAVVDQRTTTRQLARNVTDLVDYLYRAENFPDGAWLSTGTGIVPDDAFTLREGDRVSITIAEIGNLSNIVRSGASNWSYLEKR
jgi:2-dehydro-3-deoxy-D-arabinonate dehydratase